MENIFGGLIDFESKKEFNEYLDVMDSNSAIAILEMAIKYGISLNVYTFEEIHCLYVCLQKLKKE